MVKESASKIKQDSTTQMILVNRYNKQGNFREMSSLSYTPIKAYCTAVLGCRDWLRMVDRNGIRYCTIGWFQIVILRMGSLAILIEGNEERVSRVERVSSVGETDGSSLTGVSVSVCATVLLLAASVGLFAPGRIVLVFLFLLA